MTIFYTKKNMDTILVNLGIGTMVLHYNFFFLILHLSLSTVYQYHIYHISLLSYSQQLRSSDERKSYLLFLLVPYFNCCYLIIPFD